MSSESPLGRFTFHLAWRGHVVAGFSEATIDIDDERKRATVTLKRGLCIDSTLIEHGAASGTPLRDITIAMVNETGQCIWRAHASHARLISEQGALYSLDDLSVAIAWATSRSSTP